MERKKTLNFKLGVNENFKEDENEKRKLLTFNNKGSIKQILVCVIGGIFVGLVNGFFGGGGGMLVVPILTLLLKLPDKKAHATALLIIFPVSLCSSIVYLLKNDISFYELGFSGLGFCVGGILGALLLKKINNNVIRIIFSCVMIVAGIKMII